MPLRKVKNISRRSLSLMPGVETYKDINDRFIQTRKENELTQAEFAEKMGINLSLVKHIETYRVAPNVYILRTWRKVFKMSYDWIIDGK